MVMIVMALDHTRDFFSNLRFRPEDLSQATPFLFFTRWITHFCAPTFFFLAGVGAGIAVARGKSTRQISWFLLTRGLWLVFLEFTVSHIGWQFSMEFPQLMIVIWALGMSMVILSALVFLPRNVILAISIATIVLHNLLDGIKPESLGAFGPIWHILHVPGLVSLNPLVIVAYPLVPWFAVMALGFVMGDIFTWEPARRRRFLLRAGIAMTALFVVLRAINFYGDPNPWAVQRSLGLTLSSFGNVTKYPPSLMFLLMTLGPAFIALALAENARGALARVITVYGRVPMFYYIVHIYVIHILAYAFAVWQGADGSFLGLDTASFPKWYGTSLPGVYLAWAIVVLILYWPCKRFADFKARRTDWWLGYI
jgi:uncharacterized membrane protein